MPINRLERFAHNLDWNLLRTFVVVVEEGSITRAANRLLLQQPAVSMALKRLEQSVGHRLIDRSPGRFELTEAGERLHALCRDIFTAIVRLPEAMEPSGEDIAGHITIHAVSHAMNPEWDRAIADFFRLHPRVTVGVTVETTTDVIRSVERGVATLGLSDGIIEAIRCNLRPSFERRDDEIIYTYAKELHDRHGVSDAVYDDALSLIGTVGVVELTALIGYYTLVAMTLNAHAFDLPAGSAHPFREAAE